MREQVGQEEVAVATHCVGCSGVGFHRASFGEWRGVRSRTLMTSWIGAELAGERVPSE
jgi:hypothetical protein